MQNDADYIECRLYRTSSTKSGHSRRSWNNVKCKKKKVLCYVRPSFASKDLSEVKIRSELYVNAAAIIGAG